MNTSEIVVICIAVFASVFVICASDSHNKRLKAQVMIECLKQEKFDCNIK